MKTLCELDLQCPAVWKTVMAPNVKSVDSRSHITSSLEFEFKPRLTNSSSSVLHVWSVSRSIYAAQRGKGLKSVASKVGGGDGDVE